MNTGNTFANDLLKLIFNAVNIANIADNAASSPLTNLYASLHTGYVAPGGDQTTNECNYTGYARIAIVRTTSGWTVSANQVVNLAAVTFGEKTAGSDQVATHIAIGTASSGTGKVLFQSVLGTVNQGPFTAKTDDTITIPGHTFAVDDRCAFFASNGSSLPTGITEGTVYWVKTVSGNDITISTTQGGSTLDVTAVGDGIAIKAKPIAISNGIVPEFAASQIVLNLK